jgi:hypothetical protein
MLGSLFDWYARSKRLENEAIRVAANSQEPGPAGRSAELIHLQSQLDRLQLQQLALIELTLERLPLSEEQFLAKVEELDRRDGRLDGRLRLAPAPCPRCERPNHAQRTSCVYCGAALPPRRG